MAVANKVNKWLKLAVILGVAALFVVPTLVVFRLASLYAVRNYFAESLTSLTGLNVYLANAIMIIAIIPLWWALNWLFSFNKRKRNVAYGIIAVLAFGYNLALYKATENILVRPDGTPLKWYAITRSGVEYFDACCRHPVLGTFLRPVTPEIAPVLEELQQGRLRPVDPSDFDWFDPTNGEAKLWFYKYPEGTYEFFRVPAYHPLTNERLRPVTKKVFFEWRSGSLRPTDLADEPTSPTVLGQPIQSGSPLVERLRSLINTSPSIRPGVTNVAILIHSQSTQTGFEPSAAVYHLLRNPSLNLVSDVVRQQEFYDTGLFEEVYSNSPWLLREAGVLRDFGYCVLGRLTYLCRQTEQIRRDLITCDLTLSYRVLDKNTSTIEFNTVRSSGPGFSEDEALQRGIEILIQHHSATILGAIR